MGLRELTNISILETCAEIENSVRLVISEWWVTGSCVSVNHIYISKCIQMSSKLTPSLGRNLHTHDNIDLSFCACILAHECVRFSVVHWEIHFACTEVGQTLRPKYFDDWEAQNDVKQFFFSKDSHGENAAVNRRWLNVGLCCENEGTRCFVPTRICWVDDSCVFSKWGTQ